MVQVREIPGTQPADAGARKQVIGWLLPADERARLLALFEPRYERVVADHVTLRSGVVDDAPTPRETEGEILGIADDGQGVQALVVSIGGGTARPGGGTYHITWSLGGARKARESNDVLGKQGWTPIDEPVPVRLEPGRFFG